MDDYMPNGVEITTHRNPDLTDRLRSYLDSTDKLTPRQRERANFATAFRRALRLSGIRQMDLADQIGVSSSLVSAWANAISLPSAEQIEKLSAVFDTDVSAWALGREPAPRSGTTSVPSAPAYTASISADEEALIRRVRRMSEEERNALYTLLHVLK